MFEPSKFLMATMSSLDTNYLGYAVLIVNSYRENTSRYPVINGTGYDEKELKFKLEEVGFFVYSMYCAEIKDYRSYIYKLNSMHKNFPFILFIFSGYENGSQIIFEDGSGIEYENVYNDLSSPLTSWSKCPKVIIINTYKPRLGLKSLFNIKSKSLPFFKRPLCLTLQVSHSAGAAEKRGPNVHDIFVSKFIEELNISDQGVHNSDFSSILKHVKRSIETISRDAELNITVRLDDQLIEPLELFFLPSLKKNTSTSLSGNQSIDTNIFDNITSITDGLETVDWFYGNMSRESSESLLKYDGDFLIRQSDSKENSGRYVMSVLYRNMLYQIPLFISKFGVHIKNEPSFKKLTELVNYYCLQSHPIPIHDTLIRILQTPRLQTSQSLYKYSQPTLIIPKPENNFEKWFHGRVERDYVQQCLYNDGDFLVWESDSCFVISYVYHKEIHNIYACFTSDGEVSTDLISGKFESINDLVQHLILHHSYYRGVLLKNAIPPPISPLIYTQSSNIPPSKHNYVSEIDVHSPGIVYSPLKEKSFNKFERDENLLIDASIPLINQKWFSKTLNSSDVVRILERNGDFLVRTSQNRPGHLSLSVKAGGKIQTFGIFAGGNGGYTLDPNASPEFENICELIYYYVTTKQQLPATLGPDTFLKRPIMISKCN